MLRFAQHDNSHLYIRSSMRKISADYIFPVSSPPIKNGVVNVDEDGIVLEVTKDEGRGTGNVEKHDGIIVPGFVNAHCHLELSHLKGQVSEKSGLTGFISELVPKRGQFSDDHVKAAIITADEEMFRNGIVAVGDISNTDHSFDQKRKSKITYHTFVEAFDLVSEKAKEKFEDAQTLNLKLARPNEPFRNGRETLNSSVVPHAPYSVSGKLLELIDNLKQPLISIHNQETASENELFASGTGLLAEMMRKSGVDMDVKKRAKKSLLFTFGALIETKKVLLVHNTYMTEEDIELIRQFTSISEPEAVLCLCPNANLYIENRLPDIPTFIEAGMKLTLGTDSYASNWNLSILEEMKTIAKFFPKIPFENLLTWATKNGAEILGMEKEFGTIEKGKSPGLNLITGIDLHTWGLSDHTKAQKIL